MLKELRPQQPKVILLNLCPHRLACGVQGFYRRIQFRCEHITFQDWSLLGWIQNRLAFREMVSSFWLAAKSSFALSFGMCFFWIFSIIRSSNNFGLINSLSHCPVFWVHRLRCSSRVKSFRPKQFPIYTIC